MIDTHAFYCVGCHACYNNGLSSSCTSSFHLLPRSSWTNDLKLIDSVDHSIYTSQEDGHGSERRVRQWHI